MALNHTQLRALKPAEKPYKATDRDGLYLDVLPSGVMTWRFQYHLNARREKVTFGRYPEIGLADARRMREEAAALVAIGQSPAKIKQADKTAARIEAAQASTFKELSERWFADEVAFKSENWKYSVQNWLNLDILPALGKMKPKDITADDVHALVKKVVGRGSPASANKVRMICVQMFRYAVRNKELKANPAMEVEAVATPAARSHRALGVKEIGPFLLALDAVGAKEINKLAIKLMLLTFTRKDELRLAKWSEFDLDNAVWDIPAHRMKMGEPHRVYLSSQVLALLQQVKPLSFGGDYLFPNNSTRSKPIGHTTLNSIIDRLDIGGARFVPHGFRATASSILNEANFRPDVIERQLAHKETNRVRAVYNQAEYAHERREMLQWWADYVDTLQAGSNVIPINARRLARA
ncbi:tyrosine-type recombinase/integrase [Pseudoduganella sp. UC29_71]|uniref:tyrosine-type recombinase/integrase n=1 Tax=Pseudoduganella sp. UC29_71 TaxID=3350174 RepID=UPI0036704D5D